MQDIFRNIWLTLVTITILLLALFAINTLVTVRLVSDTAVAAIKEKIDISLYLQTDAPESSILALQDKIIASPRVKSVDYISKDEAITSFRERYANDQAILGALKELGRNPLSPSLTIIPKDFNESNLVISELRVLDSSIIESRDFSDNSIILSKINNITKRVNEVGLFIISRDFFNRVKSLEIVLSVNFLPSLTCPILALSTNSFISSFVELGIFHSGI